MSTVTAFPSTSILDSGATGRSLLQSATAAAARTLLDIPGQSNTWTAPQSTQISASNYIFKQVLPEASDTYSKPFNFIASSFANSDSTKNFVFRIGHNLANGGGATDASRSTLQDEWEQHYVAGGVDVVERHMGFTPAGGSVQRFITFLGRSDGTAPASSNENILGFIADKVYIRERTNTTEYLSVDAASGFAVKNVGLSVEPIGTSLTGLTLKMPNNTTGNFLTFTYNAAGFGEMNSYGQLYLTGSGKTGSAPRASLVTLRGSSSSAHTFWVEDTGGTPNLLIQSDGTVNIYRTATHYMRSSNGVYFQNLSSTTQFAVLANGQIWTNQRTARTALASPGTVTGSIELRDQAGTSIGSIPLYANGSFS